ncbi:MAG: hypothetical protein [Wendovervirus sonii]|uniref:Uncharacterized protein n=1 Tax=phage Lak_Megaphage_Sonny TaxID=3109229 RepID=A0ABZ0Z5D2_9CAUD|nr:MAG: hypothetical protein [phage Lak_Megaphage_Sonny]
MFKKFTETVGQFFKNLKQIKIDKINRELFINDIKQEIIDPKSIFNKLKLQCDPDYKYILTVINIPEEFQIGGSDIDKYRKLNELIRPINKYIISNLNWGEYFVSPEFYYIDTNMDIDNMVDDEISCAYVASWKYSPILDKYPNFKYQLTAFICINMALIAGIVLMCIFL